MFNVMRDKLLHSTVMVVIYAHLYLFQGYDDSVEHAVKKAVFNEDHDEMVVVKNIEMFSLCEHHLVPFMGHVSIGTLSFIDTKKTKRRKCFHIFNTLFKQLVNAD